mmetsp:Transcript_16894/g.34105  ORF Transcript_16894/g.34105 Transcript_16894/m.34105 type:complete len:298 (-) Transcript_16894:1826-2719(-)
MVFLNMQADTMRQSYVEYHCVLHAGGCCPHRERLPVPRLGGSLCAAAHAHEHPQVTLAALRPRNHQRRQQEDKREEQRGERHEEDEVAQRVEEDGDCEEEGQPGAHRRDGTANDGDAHAVDSVLRPLVARAGGVIVKVGQVHRVVKREPHYEDGEDRLVHPVLEPGGDDEREDAEDDNRDARGGDEGDDDVRGDEEEHGEGGGQTDDDRREGKLGEVGEQLHETKGRRGEGARHLHAMLAREALPFREGGLEEVHVATKELPFDGLDRDARVERHVVADNVVAHLVEDEARLLLKTC